LKTRREGFLRLISFAILVSFFALTFPTESNASWWRQLITKGGVAIEEAFSAISKLFKEPTRVPPYPVFKGGQMAYRNNSNGDIGKDELDKSTYNNPLNIRMVFDKKILGDTACEGSSEIKPNVPYVMNANGNMLDLRECPSNNCAYAIIKSSSNLSTRIRLEQVDRCWIELSIYDDKSVGKRTGFVDRRSIQLSTNGNVSSAPLSQSQGSPFASRSFLIPRQNDQSIELDEIDDLLQQYGISDEDKKYQKAIQNLYKDNE
jgi:hypothetical protein